MVACIRSDENRAARTGERKRARSEPWNALIGTTNLERMPTNDGNAGGGSSKIERPGANAGSVPSRSVNASVPTWCTKELYRSGGMIESTGTRKDSLTR